MHAGKPWRVVRRASDMNEYSRQIKEFRAQEKGKVHGKVFVKVHGIKNLKVPLPSESTSFTLVLNNGVFSVETPECTLAKDARVDQEFELIEHGKLEFTLTVKIQKDAHILAQLRSHAAPTPPPVQVRHPPPPPMPTELPLPPPPKASGGLFGLFGGSKKPKHRRAVTEPQQIAQPPPPPPPPAAAPKPKPVEVNLGRYLRPDGSLATAFINFSEIARRCDTKLFETSYPLKALVSENRNRNLEEQPVLGEVILHIFRLPPIPGVKPEGLPQSLEECHSGLRHIAWHKVMYHEGVLTQQGGDCNVWKRRHFRIIGANLVAYNDVTNRATTSIELKKATAVVDDQDPPETIPTITKGKIRKLEDELYPVERSFRLLFRNDVQISFYADTDEEKSKWLQMLRAMVGKIPPNPLWAELVWQRQEEMAVAAARASKAPAKTQS
ncbi:Bud site selection protein bud4 [Tulasnella sp. 418]|nr:Bud site selection protein bud4 [Tulasnella sp. 418]